MNYKKVINIILRCGLYAYLISRMIHTGLDEIGYIYTFEIIKAFIDFGIYGSVVALFTEVTDDVFNMVGETVFWYNILFFAYFYAKICGIYKLFKDYKLWQKSLIFISLSISSYYIGMFDFKNLKLFDNFYGERDPYMMVLIASIFVILAFVLNLIFEFLTKKFPKPFEKIGYWVSIEFYKNLFKNIKRKVKG